MDSNWLIAAVFIGVLGVALLAYAKRRRDAVALVVAVALLVFPYFVRSALWCVVITLALLGAFVLAKVYHFGEF